MKKILKGILNSNMGYLPFKIVEGIFGIIAIRLYTGLISTNDYGVYGLVNNTMMMIYLLTIGWFMFVAIRYVKEQKTEEDKKRFFSNQLLLQGSIVGIALVFYAIFALILIVRFNYDKTLLGIYILFFMGYGITQFYTHLLLYMDRRFMNVVLVVGSAVLKPIVVFCLYRLGVPTLYILFLGLGSVDLVMGGIAFFTIKPYRYFDKSMFDIGKFKEFFGYGFPLIGLTMTMYTLNMADRYIIRGFYSDHEVGVYIPSYSLASAAFLMINYGLTRGFYPRLLTAWKDKKIKNASEILSSGIKNFLFIALPSATGMILVSQEMGHVFIDPKFIDGYPVIGFVAVGMFFLGLTEYINKEWELSGNTKPIFIHSLIAAVINIILNMIFVPKYGFIAAAFTTSLSFILYFIIAWIRRTKTIEIKIAANEIFGILISNILMTIAVNMVGTLPFGHAVMLSVKVVVAIIVYVAGVVMFQVYDWKLWLKQNR